MRISKLKRDKSARRKKDKGIDRRLAVPAALAIAFGVIGFVLSAQYGSAVYAPALFFNGSNSTVSRSMLISSMTSTLGQANAIILQFGNDGNRVLFSLTQLSNSSAGNTTAYVIATPVYRAESGWLAVNHTSVAGKSSYMLRNGITMTDEIVTSGGYAFETNYFALPYNYSGTYAAINYEIFRPIANNSASLCSVGDYETLGMSNYVESSIYNMLRLQFGGNGRKLTCYSYSIASS
jgi:hypothetical protein